MVDIRRILCPLDLSETSRRALGHAMAMAKWYDSQLTVLHVIHPTLLPEPVIFFNEPSHIAPSSLSARQSVEAQLRDWLEPACRAGVKTETVVDEGNPASRILEYAVSRQADLVVMGTHGLGGFERFVLGSVAEKVLRKATCPVMTVPPAAETSAQVPYMRVLCPVDFSESSLAALRFAISIAKEADAHLTILNVLDWPSNDELFVEQFDTPELRQLVEGRARHRLEALVTDEMRVWCKPTTTVRFGKPYRQILELAGSEEANLVVIGIRGRNPMDLTLFGSTTNQVVRHASCPVLTLRQ